MLKRMEAISPEILGVSDLSNRPNYPLTYGGDGLSASALKARFDAVPLAVRDKVNELIALLGAHSAEVSGSAYIGIPEQSYNEGQVTASSVADLVAALADTGLAQLLMVHTGERICSLQACLQEHTEQIKKKESILWMVDGASLFLTFPDGQMVELPFAPKPKMVEAETLMVTNHSRYLLLERDAVDIRYPASEVLCSAVWSEGLGRYDSESLTFRSEYEAEGSCMFGMCPEVGSLCVVTFNDGEALPPTTAVLGAEGAVHLRLPEMDIAITPALEGVDVSVYFYEGGHQAGEVLRIYAAAYSFFEADLRIVSGANGTTVRFPSSLYKGDVPELKPASVWDVHISGGVIEAHEVLSAENAEASEAARVEAAMEVIANGTY